MSTTAEIIEPASELERLIADRRGLGSWPSSSASAGGSRTSPGVTTPLFRQPADRRWWHVGLGDDTASWTMDVRVDEITGVRFGRGPSPSPRSPAGGLAGGNPRARRGKSVRLFVHDLYDGQRMRPEKLEAWQALRERYGNRDESRVDQGRLLPPAA